MILRSSDLDRSIRIERPVADEALDGAGSGSWQTVATVRAQIQDVLPSRGERLADGVTLSTRPARVRMRFRTDLTSEMRFVQIRRIAGADIVERVMQIVSGPAEIGRRGGLEFIAENYSSAGNPA